MSVSKGVRLIQVSLYTVFKTSSIQGNDNLYTSQQQYGSHPVQLFSHQDNIYSEMPRKQISLGQIDKITS